jgi:hypothetical protein
LGFHLRREPTVLSSKLHRLGNVSHGFEKYIVIPWLRQELVHVTFIYGVQHGRYVSVPGENDPYGFRVSVSQFA